MFRRILAPLVFSLSALLCLSGCGGGSSNPLSVAVTASSANVDGTDTVTLTASVSNDKNAAGVSWAVSGGGALSNSTTSATTFTAPAATSAAQTVTVTATSVADATKTGTATITVVAKPAVTTTGNSLAATVGASYSVQLVGNGGITPYTWTVASGTLPPCLSMSTGGLITGSVTAACAGTYSPVFTMTDSGTPTKLTAITTLSVTIAAAPAIGFIGAVPSTATYNATFAGSAAAGGGAGALTYTLTSGALPTGLTVNASTGAITGAPTAPGTFAFTVTAVDAFGDSASHSYSIVVSPATPTLTFAVIAAHIFGDAPFTVSANSVSNGAVSYSVTSGPATIIGNTVTITGVGTVVLGASQAATTNYTAATASTSFTVNPETPTLTFTAIPTHTFGDAPFTVSATSASSGTVTYSVTSGPATVAGNSVTLTGAGAVVLGASQAANGNYGTATASTSFAVNPALSITTSTALSGTVSVPYSQLLAATGGSGTGYSWSVTAGGTQLAALNLSLSTSGVLSGTPPSSGSAAFTAQVADSASHTATANFSLTIYAGMTVTTASLPATNVGASYSQQLAAAGGTGTGYTWSATSSNLAAYGLSLSTAGVVSGTPTQSGSASFTANVKDSNNNAASQVLSITVYNALSLPVPDPSSLPSTGYTNVAYSGTISASGGSGNYTWSVTGLSDNLSPTPSGGTLTISGTPGASPATVTFNVTVTDATTNVSVTQNAYTITISNPTPVTLPTPSSNIPGAATQNHSYNGTITVSGGVAPYTWSINGTTVTAGGLALADSLTANSSGSSLTITGTPTTITTVNLTNVKVADSLGSNQTNSYSIAVNSAGSTVSGQINLNSNCGSSVPPTITVSLYTSPGGTFVTSTTTDGSGNYSFASVPNGSYTITPTISGPSSAFNPANNSVTVNNSAVTGENFQVALGYTVSGTVSYGGSNTGRVYLALSSTTCGGFGATGTSINAPGAFTIRGVPPGSYTLQAWMDPTSLGNGAQNTSDPTGSSAVAVTSSNVTGAGVTLNDNAPISVPSSNPSLKIISATDQGVVISYKPVTTNVNGNSVESVTSYDVQWSTSSTFATSPVLHNFKAVGTKSGVWILNNLLSGVTGSPFTNGTAYYFEARARNAAGPASGWTVYGGGTPIAVTPGASTTGIQAQGTVTIPSGVTINSGAQLYVGFYNQNTNTIYGTRLAPVAGANAYSVYVPSDSNPDYINFAILDQNNNGLIDAGDVSNTGDNNSNGISITAPLTGQNPILPTVNSTAAVTTQYYQNTNSGGSGSGYSLYFDVREANKLPVAVALTSGPNIINPVDISVCTGCGTAQFQYSANIGGTAPTVGDTYNFTVTYSDGSQETGGTVNGKVTAFGSTGAIVGPSDLPTNLAPSANSSSSLTPTFTWTFPGNPSNYIYSFYISSTCSGSCNNIWQIPGNNNSNSNGFTYAQTGSGTTGTIAWGTDPTGDVTNTPSSGLTLNTIYNWSIQVQDSNGNQAQASTWYQP